MIYSLKYFTRISLLLLLGSTACQNQETATGQVTTETTAKTPSPPSVAQVAPPGVDAIQQKQPLTAYIKKKMTEKLWHYETAIVINQPEKSKIYKGKWVKFNPDNTLVSGFYEEEGQTGRWVYDEGNDILTIIEGGERPNYAQWNVKFSSNTDDMVIWVGTTRFQNNSTQIKMLRMPEKPKKN